jgi:hypothetical protein
MSAHHTCQPITGSYLHETSTFAKMWQPIRNRQKRRGARALTLTPRVRSEPLTTARRLPRCLAKEPPGRPMKEHSISTACGHREFCAMSRRPARKAVSTC